MIGRVNTGGGGAGGTLTVTGIAGHTVTAAGDGKTYTRTFNSNGVAVFKGLPTGTWTLTMTGDGQTTTRTVVVNADYSVTLSYEFMLYDAGNQYTSITGGWSGTGYTVNVPFGGDNSAGAVSGTTLNCVATSDADFNRYSVIGTTQKVAEIANYSTLHVRVTKWANATSGELETTPKTEFGVSTSKTNINSKRNAAKVVDGTGDDITLDISNVTVSGYLWIYAQAAGDEGNVTKIVVDKIWLT